MTDDLFTHAPVVQGQDAPTPSGRRRFDSDPGAPSLSVKDLRLQAIPAPIGRELLVRHHYLHSADGASLVTFGVFWEKRLMGVIQFSRGPRQAYRLVHAAEPRDCACLARLWLADALPTNAESRVIAIALRLLHKHTALKFVVSYADPSVGHRGTVYQASGWLYTGTSTSSERYDLGDGKLRHKRSLSSWLGTNSTGYLAAKGLTVRKVVEPPKHRYVYFLDPSWRPRLRIPTQPYPRQEVSP